MDTAAPSIAIPFDNSYARLPQGFSARMSPVQVRAPRLIQVNDDLAGFLNIDPGPLHSQEGAEVFTGNRIAEGSEPLAMAYAGHQFANFVPQLGDGRACLLGEVIAQDGRRYDIQLKGSGPTPFSRRGDGRAALGPVLREYLVSEAMHRLHVPTTRALAAVLTGEAVVREEMLPGAVLTRIASSHLRVGTFEYFAAREDTASVRTLADHAISRHYPEAAQTPKRYRTLLEGVVTRQAALVAQWMGLGFIHGVMNTDNTSISGETIDYGPCAFMEAYDPATVFSAIDRQGRYAYANQPGVMVWNLSRLGETLLPLMADEEGSQEAALAAAYEVLNGFAPLYETAYLRVFRTKLGLVQEERGGRNLDQRSAGSHGSSQGGFHTDLPAPVGRGRRWRARPVQRSGSIPGLAPPLAPAAGLRRPFARAAECSHATDQPRLHPAQPPGAGGDRRGGVAAGLRPFRATATRHRQSVYRNTGSTPFCGACACRTACFADILRHLGIQKRAFKSCPRRFCTL